MGCRARTSSSEAPHGAGSTAASKFPRPSAQQKTPREHGRGQERRVEQGRPRRVHFKVSETKCPSAHQKARRRWVLKVGRPPPARKAATNTPTHSQQRLLIHSVLHLGCLFVGGVLFGTLIVYDYSLSSGGPKGEPALIVKLRRTYEYVHPNMASTAVVDVDAACAADPKKLMGFTWENIWTHITEHSMSKDEYRNMLAMQGVPLEVFDLGEK